MNTLIQIISILLDIYITKTYLCNILPNRKNHISSFWFYAAIIFVEMLLQLNTTLFIDSTSVIFSLTTNALSLISTFCLCFFFNGKLTHKIAVSVIFQILILLSEKVCVIISIALHIDSMFLRYEYEITMNLMSKIVMLLITIILSFFKKNKKTYPVEYNLLLLFTPAISFAVLIAIPLNYNYVGSNLSFFSIVWIYIAAINIVHSSLVEKLAISYMSRMHASELEKQLMYQKEKYLQLGESYKKGRKIVHDIKHHNEVLKRYISEKRYNELHGYLSSYTQDLEDSYVKINTGNLVIDALVTNYSDLASSSNIKFTSRLKVENSKIPVSDYDLCIILGNLFDNSFHACEVLPEGTAEISVSLISDMTDQFIIVVENSYIASTHSSSESSMYHGYGLDNIRNAVESYNGIIKIESGKTYKTLISIPVISFNQRYTHPTFSDIG